MDAQLAALGARLGIESSYWDLLGVEHRTSTETARALCAAMGHAAQTESQAEESLRDYDTARAERCIDPVCVFREHARATPRLALRHPGGEWHARLRITDERGGVREREFALPGAPAGRVVVASLPGHFEPGVYELELSLARGSDERRMQQVLIAAPRTALRFREKLGDRRVAGLWTNLYSVRSARNWGFGDSSDLEALARACAAAGGDFVGVNPLHAAPFERGGVSPYSPVSRFFRNALYIDVEAVPELAHCERARRLLADGASQARLAALRAADQLDCEALWAHKHPVLRELHRAFVQAAAPERRARFAAYREHGAAQLVDFATYQVLVSEGPGRAGKAWREWPAAFREPHSAQVTAFREEHAEEVELCIFLQFELDEQLARVAQTCRDSGQALGLYFDLAVGSAADSADTWSLGDSHARGVSVGAPPDAYAPQGQVWGLPPFDPNALRRGGYAIWRRLLDASMRHAGALRIDHVMGLQRQFWVPDGGSPADGAYVRFPLDDLLGVLALESRRHAALVIGEDLGTVPPGLPRELASWGILSSSVYLFERSGDAFATPSQLSPRALASVGTHDLAPFAGYAAGRELELRRAAGAIDSDEALEQARAARRAEIAQLEQSVRREGLVAKDQSLDSQALGRSLAKLVGRSPAPLVAVSLDDVAGEREPINLPGIPIDVHPSWARRMSTPLETLIEGASLREALPRRRSHSKSEKDA